MEIPAQGSREIRKTFRRVNEGEAGHPKLTQHFWPAEVAADFFRLFTTRQLKCLNSISSWN